MAQGMRLMVRKKVLPLISLSNMRARQNPRTMWKITLVNTKMKEFFTEVKKMGSSKSPEKFFKPINVISRPEVSSISRKALTIPLIMGYPIKSRRISMVGATKIYPKVLDCRLFFRIYSFLIS
jgi:hypothetical protein